MPDATMIKDPLPVREPPGWRKVLRCRDIALDLSESACSYYARHVLWTLQPSVVTANRSIQKHHKKRKPFPAADNRLTRCCPPGTKCISYRLPAGGAQQTRRLNHRAESRFRRQA